MDKYLILVNKNNKMVNDDDYIKVNCNSKYDDSCLMEEETYRQWLLLRKEVLSKGYIIDCESCYRSSEHQQRVWDEVEAEKGLEHTKKYVAVPGYSEHQSGLAVDFTLYENDKWFIDHDMKGHPIIDIVKEIAPKYGFIIRYPLGKEDITGYGWEPWHLRYVGNSEIAQYIMDNNICLEEYLELENKKSI